MLRFRRKIVERELKMIEMGFSVLDAYKRDLLEMHYVNNIPSPTVAAMEKYYKERSQIFEDKRKHLKRLPEPCTGLCLFDRRTGRRKIKPAAQIFCAAGSSVGESGRPYTAGRPILLCFHIKTRKSRMREKVQLIV